RRAGRRSRMGLGVRDLPVALNEALQLPGLKRGAEARQRLRTAGEHPHLGRPRPSLVPPPVDGRGRVWHLNSMDSIALVAVRPARPVAPWVGGKRNLAKRLVAMISEIPHRTYAEPFVGMGGVFLRRDRRPQAEVINDWSYDVANLFRILQRHYVAFMDMLRFQLTTRSEFERLLRVDASTLTDLERAARFLYLQRLVFGGMPTSGSFAFARHNPA